MELAADQMTSQALPNGYQFSSGADCGEISRTNCAQPLTARMPISFV
jgi:hypothetical protein